MSLNAARDCGLLVFVLALLATPSGAADAVPYKVHKRTLANGLDVLVVPMPEFKGVLSYNTVVLAGARNEVERGKTGLAHLFEHILFRHRYQGRENGYDHEIDRLGAHNNAWTSFDVTFYHPLTFVSNLDSGAGRPGLLELESGRFTGLDFTEKIFKTEAGAVLGEYRRQSSNPLQKMEEVLLELAFKAHPYGHTTIGYLDDVQDMPNEYEAARAFYETYYRPDNCVLVVAGDVRPEEIFEKVERYYGSWARRDVKVAIPGEPPQGEERRGRVEWEADVAPRILIAYKAPAFEPGSAEAAAGQIAPELLFSESAPLYQKLRYRDKTVASLDSIGSEEYESVDPRLFECLAVLFKDQLEAKGPAYLSTVEAEIVQGMEALADFSKRPEAAGTLEILKSKYRYDLLAKLTSPATLAELLARSYRFTRDPDVLAKLLDAVARLTPADVDAFARAYFRKEGRIVVSLVSRAASLAGGGR